MAEGEGIEPSSLRRRGFRDRLLTLSATLQTGGEGEVRTRASLRTRRLSMPLPYRSATPPKVELLDDIAVGLICSVDKPP